MPPQENEFRPNLTKTPGSAPIGPATPPPQATTPIPQVPASPPSAPGPAGKFDFILTDPQKPKSKFGLPSNLPKPALILLVLVPVIFIVLILGSIFGGGNGNSTQVVDLLSQNQEIMRITATYQKNITDGGNLNLSATTIAALTTQQTQFNSYLAKNKVKTTPLQLAAHLDKTTDVALQNAILNNKFDSTYIAYLNSAIQKYQSSISATFKTSSKNFGKLLQTDYASNKVLLSSSQFALN